MEPFRLAVRLTRCGASSAIGSGVVVPERVVLVGVLVRAAL